VLFLGIAIFGWLRPSGSFPSW